MPKVRIYKNERWPEYEIDDSGDLGDFAIIIELTDEELGKIKAADTLYNEAQELLKNKVEAVEEATLPKRRNRKGDVFPDR